MANLDADCFIHLRVESILFLWSIQLDVHETVFNTVDDVVFFLETFWESLFHFNL